MGPQVPGVWSPGPMQLPLDPKCMPQDLRSSLCCTPLLKSRGAKGLPLRLQGPLH